MLFPIWSARLGLVSSSAKGGWTSDLGEVINKSLVSDVAPAERTPTVQYTEWLNVATVAWDLAGTSNLLLKGHV